MTWEPDEIYQPWVVAEEIVEYLEMTRPAWDRWGRVEGRWEVPLEEGNHFA